MKAPDAAGAAAGAVWPPGATGTAGAPAVGAAASAPGAAGASAEVPVLEAPAARMRALSGELAFV
jgi:hypothetical protein